MASHNREELIEKAAKAIGEYEWALDRKRGDESQRIWGHRGAFVADCHPTHEGRASAALAVFEQAHAPTDDDREWVEEVNRALFRYDQGQLDVRGVAEALRRTVQGEHVFIERYGIHHAQFGGIGGDVTSLGLTREAWKAMGEPDVLAVSVVPVEQGDDDADR